MLSIWNQANEAMKTTIITFLLIYLPLLCFSQEEGLELLKNNIQISIKNKDLPHVEPHLVVHPTQKNHLVAVSMVYDKPYTKDRIVTYYSDDGGHNWQEGKFSVETVSGTDPWLAYGNDGTVYLVYLPGYAHLSEDNGKTWSEAYRISGDSNQPYDFIKINVTDNHVCISASQSIRDENNDLVSPISIIMATKDLSQFEPPIQILPGNLNYQIGIPATIPGTDTLLIPFYEMSDIDDNLLEYNRIWVILFDAENRKVFTPKWTGFAGGSPTLVINPVLINRVHLFWYERTEQSWKMKSSFSDDNAIHWSEPVGVEDVERSEGDYGIQPTVAINKEGGIGVIWPDHRTDSLTNEYGVYFSYSGDGGNTFSNSILISNITSPNTKKNEIQIGNSGRTVAERFAVGGDYYGLSAIENNEFVALWSSNKTGAFQLWVNIIKLNEKYFEH